MCPHCRWLGIALLNAAILLVPAFGQSPNGPGGNNASMTTSPATVPRESGPGGSGASQALQSVRIRGRVMVDDGSAPSSRVVIERECNGSTRAEGYTDGSGYFSLVLGEATDVVADAGEISGTSNGTSPVGGEIPTKHVESAADQALSPNNRIGMGNCELRARLGGYVSQSISLGSRTPLDNPDVGVILIHRTTGSETGIKVTATTLKAPKEARQALQKGMELAKKNKLAEAIANIRRAVQVDPDFAFAWCELGKLQAQSGHPEDAHASFEAAVRAEPRWPEPYLYIAVMAVSHHNWNEAADTTGRIVSLDSFAYPIAYFFNGVANFNLRNLDLAEKSALTAERLDVRHGLPQVEDLLGTIYLERQEYSEAAEKFRAYLALSPNSQDAVSVRQQLADTEKLAAESPQSPQKDARQ
jgi:tetratricopeptide (TPR) repeat protein